VSYVSALHQHHFKKDHYETWKKDKQLHEELLNQIDEIMPYWICIDHYKNLDMIMKDSNTSSYRRLCLYFTLDEKTQPIYFDDFDHHDRIYK